MKKVSTIARLLVITFILFVLVGCSKKEITYTVLNVGTVSDGSGGKHIAEVPEWSGEKLNPHEDYSAPAEMTVKFNGNVYIGNYNASYTKMPNAYASHNYTCKLEDGSFVDFDVNAQTYELTYISIFRETMQTEKLLEEAECRKIADSLAKEYISLGDYKVKEDSYSDYDYTAYGYTYYREVSGYETTDQIRIVVNGNGTVTSCDFSMLGNFKNVKKTFYR